MLIENLEGLKQLKTPKPFANFEYVLCTNPIGPWSKGSIHQLHFTSHGLAYFWCDWRAIPLEDLYNNFLPFGWTPSKRPGREVATVWPWKRG